MAVNYAKINEDIVKIIKGFGYNVKLYDEFGNGPISNTKNTSYIYLSDEGILFSLPEFGTVMYDDIFVYIGNEKNSERFKKMIKSIRVYSRMNGIGISIHKDYNVSRITPAYLSHEAKAKKELENEI